MDISTTLAGVRSTNIAQNAAAIGLNSSNGMIGKVRAGESLSAEGTMFDTLLNSAIDNLKTTNGYLSDAENEKSNSRWARRKIHMT